MTQRTECLKIYITKKESFAFICLTLAFQSIFFLLDKKLYTKEGFSNPCQCVQALIESALSYPALVSALCRHQPHICGALTMCHILKYNKDKRGRTCWKYLVQKTGPNTLFLPRKHLITEPCTSLAQSLSSQKNHLLLLL